ncbi:hypothetical protein [Geobacter sulfurreducens]|uniref:hypothetical protein n=1 Tax=Geobacter sulfurreducens TaxID=35554 RepID=UPI000DBB0A8B|nr:hypothetical protein [Geobacter sulfurreducens]BBA70036.1 hypothetical protein YM18_1501 [Geobacter sulfurreducens]
MIDVDELRAPITLSSTLYNHIWHMQSEFRIIGDLVQNMEDYFLQRCVDFEKYEATTIKKSPKYRREELEEQLEDEYNVLLSMPVLIRHSLFTSTYSLLEAFLNDLCSEVKKERNLLIDINDLSGAGIFRAQTYLSKILNVEFPSSHRSWQRICNYNKLRNCLVHADGQLSKESNKQLLKFIKAHKYLEVNVILKVQLQDGFVQEVCDTMAQFVQELIPKVIEAVEA